MPSREYDRAAGQGPEPVFMVVEQDDRTFKSVNPDEGVYLPVAAGGALGSDAWGRQKNVRDLSLFHGMFTFNVPVDKWKESIDGVEQPAFSSATSVDGKLNLVSGALNEKRQLQTFRFPRYEPNRGHLYSTSAFLPDPTALGERSFGMFTPDAGLFFRLRAGVLYAVSRTTVQGVTTDTEHVITLPEGVDLSKGNTFDIQAMWRGVGNFTFFIDLKPVLTVINLGMLTELSIYNPAMPLAFEVINQGDEVTLNCGCVDVSSEGGVNNGKTYGSLNTPSESASVAITGFNIPVLAVRNKLNIGSLVNTRDMLALLATAYADQRCVFRVWVTRDESVLTLNDQVWTDYGDGHSDFIHYGLNPDGTALVGTAMTFNPAGLTPTFGARVNQDISYATSALFEGRTDIYQTPGDILIFTMHRETGGATNVGTTYEFAQSI